MSNTDEKIKERQIFNYLDALRKTGVVNMFGAGVYLQRDFPLTKEEANQYLLKWMENFDERNSE
jgi:hypothetical protein